jgi:hypothetical protein
LDRKDRPLEALEPRILFSTAAGPTLHSDLEFDSNRASTRSADVQGYTPTQIQTAYGFNQISVGAAAGAGQTIAIVDAFNDPHIAADLAVFDSQFSLPPGNLDVVNQVGGGPLPATNAGWASEIALDVEWVHAIAPGADILLVETNSDATSDLMSGVNYARHAAGVSVVSMSWGGSEFSSFAGGESETQLSDDPIFTTPAGHAGVTFVASAGDTGARSGAQWPASSPNVLSVGGTTLNLASTSGAYGSETGWSGTSSGYSKVEPEPAYQQSVQETGKRSVADVSYDANPSTGFAIYDSVKDQGYTGWQVVGGTSAGAPQWAALIAIANQQRVSTGQAALAGPTQTLATLYSLYAAPGTTAYSTYTTYFNDVGSSAGVQPGRSTTTRAAPGYDLVTGLGTPRAADIVDALAGITPPAGGTGGPVAPSELPASPLSPAFVGKIPVSVIAGQPGSSRLRITNTSGLSFDGPVSITLYASTDGTLSNNPIVLTTRPIPHLKQAAGHSAVVTLRYDYPATLSGSNDLVAVITTTAIDTTPATAVTGTAVIITPPTVDPALAFTGTSAVTVNPDRYATATLRITNLGNVTAAGTLNLTLTTFATASPDQSQTVLSSITNRHIKIIAGKLIRLRIRFLSPAAAAGTYDLIASITSATTPADENPANNTAVATTAPVER